MPRFRYMQPLLRDGEGGGSGDPAQPTTTQQPTQPAAARQQPAATTQPQPQDGAGNANQRRTEADWRADIAAQRVAREQLETQLATERTQRTAEVEAARADAERRVQEVTAQHQTKEQKLQGKLIETALSAAATAAGLVDPDLIPLMDRSNVKLDDEGNVVGVTEAIAEFKTKKPSFFKDAAAATATTTTTQQTTTQTPPSQTGSARNPPADPNPPLVNVKDMSKTEYDAFFKTQVRDLRRAG